MSAVRRSQTAATEPKMAHHRITMSDWSPSNRGVE